MATTVTLKPNAIDLSGSTSGTTTLQATAVAGTTTITLPAATDTLVGKATTDTLTNKTLTTPVISTISNTGTLTLPTSTDTLVGRATTDTLTNKTLTTPVISSLSSASATALTLQSAGTTAIAVDTSQNVGIGVTPSAWGSAYKPLQINAQSALWGTTDSTFLSTNEYVDSAGQPRYIQTGTAMRYRQDNGTHIWSYAASGTAGNALTYTQAMTLNASGNVGIGTSSPSTKLAVAGSLGVTGQANFVTSSGSPNMTIGNTANGNTGFIMSWLSTDSASVKNWQWTFNNYSNGMSLLSSTTSGSSAFVLADTLWNVKDAGQQTITDKPAANTSAFKFLSFVSNSAEAGSITRVAQTSAVTYNTTSDYRLKNNQAPLTGSGEFIDALKPKTWEWVSGGKATGFIAHEFAEVSPSSVTGEKDATQEEEYLDSSGVKATRTVPLYQGMQASSSEVIANLVAELQSLRKRVALLEAK